MSKPNVTIVGAGPAGLSAAVTAAGVGLAVTVIDERPQPGGRLRFDHAESTNLASLLADCDRLGVAMRSNSVAWGIFPGWRVPLESPTGSEVMESDHVILATGSTDRGLSFDGNTLPGVMSGSGLRRLIGEYGVLPGKRVVILGDGSDGAQTAHVARSAGARVATIIAEADARSISVQGTGGVERVLFAGEEIPADIVAVAVGREPDLQLATMAGVALAWAPAKGGWAPRGNEHGGDQPAGLWVAGDAAGVDTVDVCALDGAYVAARLAHSLGAMSESSVAALEVQLNERRPRRFEILASDPIHRQPWRVPLEVSQ